LARCCAVAALLAAPLAAQRLPINRYGAEDGLSGTQIWDLKQDSRGLIWVAATWGISSYDGVRFTTLSTREGLPSANARTVIEGTGGDLWFGSNRGVARFDGRTVRNFRDDPTAPQDVVWSSVLDREGRLWFGTRDGLYRWTGAAFRRYGRADGLADDYVYGLHVAGDGTLWVGSRGSGVSHCALDSAGDPVDCRVLARRDGLGAEVVRSFAETADGRILIGTRGGGVSIWDGERLVTVTTRDGLPSDDVYTLFVRRNGEVVVGTTDDGLAICLSLTPLRCQLLREENGLPEDGIRTLYEDREGSLWIGTEGGLGQLVRDDLWNYGEREGLIDRHVYALAADRSGGLWVGTFEGLTHLAVGVHGQPQAESFQRPSGMPANWVWALLVDRFGDLWVGTESGVCRLRAGRCSLPAAARALAGVQIFAFAETADGTLWVGTTDGVFRLLRTADGSIESVERFDTADGLANSRANGIVEDRDGRLWFASGEELTLFENGEFRRIGRESGLDWASVRSLGLDRSGRLLVGGYGRVARLESPAGETLRFRVWDHPSELGSRMVLTLYEDKSGRWLLGTNRGVLLFDPEAAEGAGLAVAHLDTSSGAIAAEVSNNGAFARDSSGRLWFGFKGGLTGLLGPLAPTPPAPKVLFSRLESKRRRVFAAPFTEVGAIPVGWLGASLLPTLPHDDNSLSVTVRAPSYVRRGDVRFQFRLDDGDSEWSAARSEPFRDLMNVAAGRHRLFARAAYADGPWGEPAALEFEIESAWWQSSYVPVLAALLAVLGITAVIEIHGRRERRLRAELERRIAERTDDLARYATALGEHLQTVDRVSDRARRSDQNRRELFARASHELRTPLTAVLGFSELLERSLGDRLGEKERRYLGHVRESGELLLRQVNELLEHLRLESGRVELHLDEVGLESMVSSVVSLMEGFALHRGVRLETQAVGDLPAVRVDVAKLRQVLMNLLSNAIKFSPAGESVEIAVRPLAAGTPSWQGPAYEIAVTDHGSGIPAEELETIFEPYRRLESSSPTPGTGLGLPIARQLVDLMGGTLTAESSPGAGATFTVRLPVDPDPVAPLAEAIDSGSVETQRAQILVLEPDWNRFSELTSRIRSDDVLAVRVEGIEPLRRTIATLRPQALVVPFDPAEELERSFVPPAIALARERKVPVMLVARARERAAILTFARAIAADASESDLRLALRAAGLAPRSFGRRPLVLIGAGREVGVLVGATLSAAGCDHFRVEGVAATRAALAETSPDAGLIDLSHALQLAAESAPRGESALGWILLDVGLPNEEQLLEFAASVLERGGNAAALLAESLTPYVAGSARGAELT